MQPEIRKINDFSFRKLIKEILDLAKNKISYQYGILATIIQENKVLPY